MARKAQAEENYWPGFVDALSTIVMVITFLLILLSIVIFVLSQNTAKRAIDDAQAKSGAGQVKVETKSTAEAQARRKSEAQKKTTAKAQKKVQSAQKSQSKSQSKAQSMAKAQSKAQSQAKAQSKAQSMAKAQSKAQSQAKAQSKAQSQAKAQSKSQSQAKASRQSSQKSEMRVAQEKEETNTTAGQFKPREGKRLTQAEKVESKDKLEVRSRAAVDEKRIVIAPEEKPKEKEKIKVVTSKSLLTLEFPPSNVKIDEASVKAVQSYLSSSADIKAEGKIEIRSFANSTVGSISEARRLAYYRAMATRNQLLKGGVDPKRISIRIRETTVKEEQDLVKVYLKP